VSEPGALIVTSFLDGVLAAVKRLRPDLRTGLLLGRRPAELHPLARAERCGADYVAPHFTLARLGLLKRAVAAGFPAIVWTVNQDDAIRGFLEDDRVAAIITDLPARALELRDG
jgi:glycerophosphoryl diester phosphodiesterase